METERDPRLPGAGEGGAAEQASLCLDCWPESKPVRKEGRLGGAQDFQGREPTPFDTVIMETCH